MKYLIIGFVGLILIGILLFPVFRDMHSVKVGNDLVNALYHFIPNRLREQDETLEKILTAELFRLYTLGSDQRQLRAYLKFDNNLAVPRVIHAEPGRIVYYLDTPTIDSQRTFQLEYRHRLGTVYEIAETELFFLLPSSRGYFGR